MQQPAGYSIGHQAAQSLPAPATPSPYEMARSGPDRHISCLLIHQTLHPAACTGCPFSHSCLWEHVSKSPPASCRRRSFRESGDGSAADARQQANLSRPLTPELPQQHHERLMSQHPQPGYLMTQQQPSSYAPLQEATPRTQQRRSDGFPQSSMQQRQPQHAQRYSDHSVPLPNKQPQAAHQLRTPPQQSVAASPVRAEAEDFFMQRGARRAAVEGGGDTKRPGNRPFGTEESLEVSGAPQLTEMPGAGAAVEVPGCRMGCSSRGYRAHETTDSCCHHKSPLGWRRS